jgi:hypothetical protein
MSGTDGRPEPWFREGPVRARARPAHGSGVGLLLWWPEGGSFLPGRLNIKTDRMDRYRWRLLSQVFACWKQTKPLPAVSFLPTQRSSL